MAREYKPVGACNYLPPPIPLHTHTPLPFFLPLLSPRDKWSPVSWRAAEACAFGAAGWQHNRKLGLAASGGRFDCATSLRSMALSLEAFAARRVTGVHPACWKLPFSVIARLCPPSPGRGRAKHGLGRQVKKTEEGAGHRGQQMDDHHKPPSACFSSQRNAVR